VTADPGGAGSRAEESGTDDRDEAGEGEEVKPASPRKPHWSGVYRAGQLACLAMAAVAIDVAVEAPDVRRAVVGAILACCFVWLAWKWRPDAHFDVE
jgi:hypothetical protein